MGTTRSTLCVDSTNCFRSGRLSLVELLEHVKTHLRKFVPTSVLQIVERDPPAPALDKREQDVTVLCLDIAGYTSLSETLDQEKVNSIVERYCSSFLDDMYANRGDIKLVST